ncbi:MAG: hypothetical protein PW734_04065 [Verrucomicrobium sp.]|nr:hypothetical protein [Verrucomicrobium sp.]
MNFNKLAKEDPQAAVTLALQLPRGKMRERALAIVADCLKSPRR